MSNGLIITAFGFDELVARLEKAPELLNDEVKAKIEDGAQAIAAEAKQRAPVNFGILKNLIVVTQNAQSQGASANVESLAEYSAYVEFGTGTRVSIAVDPDEREYEASFKTGKEVPGMYARPFLFPALHRIAPIIVNDIEKSLDKI